AAGRKIVQLVRRGRGAMEGHGGQQMPAGIRTRKYAPSLRIGIGAVIEQAMIDWPAVHRASQNERRSVLVRTEVERPERCLEGGDARAIIAVPAFHQMADIAELGLDQISHSSKIAPPPIIAII